MNRISPPRTEDTTEHEKFRRKVCQLLNQGGEKAATANRPKLTAEYAGYGPYFDTTLAANGKPIWWTGSQWVDATGTAV